MCLRVKRTREIITHLQQNVDDHVHEGVAGLEDHVARLHLHELTHDVEVELPEAKDSKPTGSLG